MSKIKILVFMVGTLASAVAIAKPAKPAAQSSSEAVNGLQMFISPDENAEAKRKPHGSGSNSAT
jgi:hypothetical protein